MSEPQADWGARSNDAVVVGLCLALETIVITTLLIDRRRVRGSVRALALLTMAALAAGGCRTTEAPLPDYDRQLAPGEAALQRVTDPLQIPSLHPAFRQRNAMLLEALQRSVDWFALPSTVQHFPIEGVTHRRAQLSVAAMRHLVIRAQTPEGFQQQVNAEFDVYRSVGYDRAGSVLFTGYYAPEFRASRAATAEFRYPLYQRPPDLVTDPATGEVRGQRVGEGVAPYPTRREIETTGMLRGHELVWMRDPFEAYIVQVQGSARLTLRNGDVMHVGYAGTNGRPYTPIGRLLVAEGKLPSHRLNLPALRDYFQKYPGELSHYLFQNERYVFFRVYDGRNWPAGSLGFRVTPQRTLATDKRVFPRGGVVLVRTRIPTSTGGEMPWSQLMLDQDTGGAIRAPGRADIYMGVGEQAQHLAGRQLATGELFYYFLKPDRLSHWERTLGVTSSP